MTDLQKAKCKILDRIKEAYKEKLELNFVTNCNIMERLIKLDENKSASYVRQILNS